MLSAETIRSLLPLLIALPAATAVALPFLGRTARAARQSALSAALLQMVVAVLVVYGSYGTLAKRTAADDGDPQVERERVFVPEFVPGDPGVDKVDSKGNVVRVDSHTTTWDIAPLSKDNPKVKGFQFFIGLDGINVWLVALAALMIVPAILISWNTVADGAGAYYGWLFALQACVMGVFLAFDIILFYVCFELTLVPLFFLISAWGVGPNRRDAARNFFLFTLAGGLFTLLGIAGTVVSVWQQTGELTFSIPRLAEMIQQQLHVDSPAVKDFWRNRQIYIFLALAVGFLVKIPLVPLHSWLPGAYAEAPIGVTVLLSALLAKMGTFGLMRICLPLAPDGALAVGLPGLGVLAAVGIIYGAFCAYAQKDFKRLIAYSSLSHLGFCALAILAFNATGLAGGLLHMVNHGLSTGAMFLVVGFVLERYSSSQIADYSGIWQKLPVLTFFMMVFCLASVGLPGLNNFVSEMLMLGGLFDLRGNVGSMSSLAVAAAFGILLSAWYTLTMLQRAFFNQLREPPPAAPGEVKDLSAREWWIAAPLAALCLVLGLHPQPLLDTMRRDVDTLARVADDARAGHEVRPSVTASPKAGPESIGVPPRELKKN